MALLIRQETLRAVERLAQAKDRRTAIMREVGDLSGVSVMFNMVLVVPYIGNERTKGNIIRPVDNLMEDAWQGKAALVIKMGPDAFVDDRNQSFGESRVAVGDWVAFKQGDAWKMFVRDVPCRLVEDSQIRIKLADPSILE